MPIISSSVASPRSCPGAEDEFSELHARDTGGRKEIPLRIAATCVCLVLSLACFAFLMWSSGHKEGVEGIVLTWQEKIYFDLYLIGAGVLFFILIFPLMEFLYGWGYASQESYENQVSAIVVSLCVTAMTALAVLVLRTLVVRCKAGVLARTTLVCRACSWIWSGLLDAIRSFPMIWRSVAGFLAYLVLCFFARRIWWDNPIPLFLVQSWDAAVAVPLECLLPAPAEGERGHRGRQPEPPDRHYPHAPRSQAPRRGAQQHC